MSYKLYTVNKFEKTDNALYPISYIDVHANDLVISIEEKKFYILIKEIWIASSRLYVTDINIGTNKFFLFNELFFLDQKKINKDKIRFFSKTLPNLMSGIINNIQLDKYEFAII